MGNPSDRGRFSPEMLWLRASGHGAAQAGGEEYERAEKAMNKFVIRQSLLLLLAALIWGVAFVAQSVGMDYVEPFTFNAVRSLVGGVTLLPCIALLGRVRRSGEDKSSRPEGDRRSLWIAGITCGVLLCIATNFQQIGIQYTTVGKSGFITAMYIVIVPILGLFIGKKAGIRVWCAVALTVAGLYFLCMTGGGFTLQKGDVLTLLCAFTFSFHILTVDHFAERGDGVKLSCIQFFVSGTLSAIAMFVWEEPHLEQILAAWLPILYAGVLSCGVAYTLQIIGQRGMNPAVASLLLSMESVISVLAGWVLLKQKLTGRELAGCVLMFLAIILVQLPQKSPQVGEKMN